MALCSSVSRRRPAMARSAMETRVRRTPRSSRRRVRQRLRPRARTHARTQPAPRRGSPTRACARLAMTMSAWTRASRMTVVMRSRTSLLGCRLDAVFVRVLEDGVEKAQLSVRRRERSEVTHLDLVAFTLDRSDRVCYSLQLSECSRLEEVA